MCGIKLCAPFHPRSLLSDQNCSSCSANNPVGQAYRTYCRCVSESKVGSLTCANSQSDANCTPRYPVAANALCLKMYNTMINIEYKYQDQQKSL